MFLIRHFCALERADVRGGHLALFDYQDGEELREPTWSINVYPGQVVELRILTHTDDRKPSDTPQAANGLGNTRLGASHPSTFCHLCSRNFGSKAALGRHTGTHRIYRPCPRPCGTCMSSLPTVGSNGAGCAHNLDHSYGNRAASRFDNLGMRRESSKRSSLYS